ncbi:MAG: UvrD-helicase domain-containing protein, partial [Bacteroidales bacterium]|nr:UvrD-helicase domain-containing protein [Bacteroidales bacterium]
MKHSNFLIYRASAGTGKTFSLVKEYLSIILKEPNAFKHTLAITFTNKAAEEMKSRILMHLANISKGRDDAKHETWHSMVPALQQATGLSETALITNAETALSRILHGYSSFSVGTIDSFTHALVQVFAREMGLPVGFELELNSDNIITNAVEQVVSLVGENQLITDILTQFVKTKIDDNKYTEIVDDLQRFAHKTLGEEGIWQREKLSQFTLEELQEKGKIISDFLQKYSDEIRDLASPVYDRIKHLQHAFFQGDKGIASFFEKLASEPLSFSQNSYVRKTVEENRWFSGKAAAFEKAEIETLKPYIEDNYFKITALQEENKAKITLFGLMRRNLFSMMLLNEINRAMIAERNESGIVHISELNKKIAEIVAKEPVPFIYERIGERYKNYLIDEFQDTSVLQWNNFIPLILNCLSESGLSMIVGDGKQAIYRWRSGEVAQFERLSQLNGQDTNNEAESVFQQNLRIEQLGQNFRSEKEIVDFNNRLFDFAKSYIPDSYSELCHVYSDLYLESLPEKQGGFVSVQFVPENPREIYRADMCQALSNVVRDLLERRYAQKDIAVLCRSNNSCILVAQYLLEAGFSVASSDSLLISSAKTVKLLVAALTYLLLPDAANGAVFWLLLSKVKNTEWDDQFMEQINTMSQKEFQEILKKHGYDVDFQHIEKMILIDAAMAFVTSLKINDKHDLYVRFFLDALIEAQTEDVITVSDFPKWWQEKGKKQTLSLSDSADAVKVMTIHKSKGLGFPIVIYPFADKTFERTTENIWVDLDEETYHFPAALLPLNSALQDTDFAKYYHEEEAKNTLDLLNIFYVACTRPKNELYILSKYKLNWNAETRSVPSILHDFLVSENLWEDEKSVYTFGTPSQVAQKPTPNAAVQVKEDDISFIPWYERISIKRHAQGWAGDKLHLILLLVVALLTYSLCASSFPFNLSSGDLVFVASENSDFERSIAEVTRHGDKALNFTHVGIINVTDTG